MKQREMSFLEWTNRFATPPACLAESARHRWPEGFFCPRCGHDRAYGLNHRAIQQCAGCRYQVPVTAGTVFHHTHVALPKWFAAIYLMSAHKGGVSALRLSKLIEVSWPTAYRMLRLLRRAMADRDRSYWLSVLFEVDDALVGGRRAGKRGHGAEGRTPVLLAVENRGRCAGYLAAQALPTGLNQAAVRGFVGPHIGPEADLRSDALGALRSLGEHHAHEARVTPPDQATEWLPKMHFIIASLKRFIRGVNREYLQDYVDEFVYRFNRRQWEPELPQRLLQAAVAHVPIQTRLRKV